VYPSPGQSFLIIPQPGHAGFGVDFRRDFRKRRLCGFSITIFSMEFIWRAPFRDKIGSACTFALATRGSEAVTHRRDRSSGEHRLPACWFRLPAETDFAGPNHEFTLMNTNGLAVAGSLSADLRAVTVRKIRVYSCLPRRRLGVFGSIRGTN